MNFQRKLGHMKKKPDIVYIIINILCLALLIADIELKNYFSLSGVHYDVYHYPFVMTNLAGPFIVCLLILFRQSHHLKASILTKIVVDSSSAVVFLMYNFFIFNYRLMPSFPPESYILLCLFIVPAVYNIYKRIQSKASSKNI